MAAGKKRLVLGLPLPCRDEVDDALTPADVLEMASTVVFEEPQRPASTSHTDRPSDLEAYFAREAEIAVASANEWLTGEIGRINRYIDDLHAKQPGELMKKARAARAPSRIPEAREFMRQLVLKGGHPTERILDKAPLDVDNRQRVMRTPLSLSQIAFSR